MSNLLRYFAYGSNMHPARLRERTPSCRRVAVATLPGYSLYFHQASATDGSAKCNILESAHPAAMVHGVLFEIPARERPMLDQAEDLGRGYQLKSLTVLCEGQEVLAFCYVAMDDTIDDALLPFSWYRDIVLHGARQHAFPNDYLAVIAAQAAMDDTDHGRATRHQQLLDIHEPI